MLKSLQRYAILNKVDNGIICCLRQFNRKMQDQGKYQSNQNYCNDDNRHFNEFRKWITVSTEPKKPGFAFSVLNYNILSQQLLEMHSNLYQDHANQALRWNQRFYNIIGEIFHNNPDILCCQEVQKSHLPDIKARLKSMNYEVVYKKRTGDKPDGCAIFYKRHLFNLIEHHKVEFEQPGIALLDRENVAVVCKFELVADPSIRFCVATTHLLYNPKRQDIRLAQVQILLAELDRIAKIPITREDGEQDYLPVILSGDFNLQPYSAPYNLIVDGMLNYENLSPKTLNSDARSANQPCNGRSLLPIKLGITDECQHVNQEIKLYHSEINKRQTENDIELTKEIVNIFQTGVLRHNFKFMSAYQKPENYVSTYHHSWILVDYMFYTSGSSQKTPNSPELKLLSYLALPSAEACERIRLRIPNDRLGSDHLMLTSRFFLSSNSPSTSTKL